MNFYYAFRRLEIGQMAWNTVEIISIFRRKFKKKLEYLAQNGSWASQIKIKHFMINVTNISQKVEIKEDEEELCGAK